MYNMADNKRGRVVKSDLFTAGTINRYLARDSNMTSYLAFPLLGDFFGSAISHLLCICINLDVL